MGGTPFGFDSRYGCQPTGRGGMSPPRVVGNARGWKKLREETVMAGLGIETAA